MPKITNLEGYSSENSLIYWYNLLELLVVSTHVKQTTVWCLDLSDQNDLVKLLLTLDLQASVLCPISLCLFLSKPLEFFFAGQV